jgi:hypothetical protein
MIRDLGNSADEREAPEYRPMCDVTRVVVLLALLSLLLSLATGCGSLGKIEDPLGSRGAPTEVDLVMDVSAAAARQIELEAAAQEIQALLSELHANAGPGWRKRGYFTGAEHDAIEWLFFRFVHNHRSFWGEIDRLGGVGLALTSEADRPGAHLLVLHAGLALAEASAFLVSEFREDPIAVAKLNELFYRSEIPADTYDRIALAATNATRRKTLSRAWALHNEETANPGGKSSMTTGALDDPKLVSIQA